MFAVVLTSIIAYVSTEIDDLLVLFVLFSRTKERDERVAVVVGKFVGLALITCCCSLFAVYISHIPGKYIGLLGCIPAAIGVKVALTHKNAAAVDAAVTQKEQTAGAQKNISALVALVCETVVVTLASSGDNIAIYIPFFTSLHGLEFLLMALVFVVMQSLWCAVAILVVNSGSVQKIINRWYRVIVPVLFILLGVYILFKNGTIAWLFGK